MYLSKLLLSASQATHKNTMVTMCILSCIIIIFLLSGAIAASESDIEGVWVGVMVYSGKQGDAEITITRDGESYKATYQGLPSFNGQLFNVRYQPGKRPNTMTLTMTSRVYKEGQNEAVLRFYLLREPGKPQLSGIIRLDKGAGADIDFNAVFEKQPCCDSKCIHPGKSRCY